MRKLIGFLAAATIGALLLSSAQAADLAAEETAIRNLDNQWLEAVAAGDAASTAAFYAEDGQIMPTGSPAAQGREAVAAVWQSLMDLPDFSLIFAPTRIVIAESADVAWETGTYDLSFTSESGPVADHGKYVVTWTKVNGRWLVGADIFNSDGPQP
jgi:uncharacterized protein (TIGR02246 family)